MRRGKTVLPLFMAALAAAQAIVWVPAARAALPAAALQTRFLTILYPEGEERAARELGRSADPLCERVLRELGTTPTRKVRVALAADLAQLRSFLPPGVRVASWVAGLAIPGEDLILLRIRTPGAGHDPLERVFLHEWAHLALAQAVSNRPLPHWFQEGFALRAAEEWSFDRARTLAAGVLANRIFSLEALGDTFPSGLADAELAYAQSIDFIAFLQERYGQAAFHRLLTRLAAGRPFLDALEEATDEGLLTIEDDWRHQLRLRFTWIPAITGTGTVWFVAALVFLAAYLKKRRNKREAIARMEDDPADDLLGWADPPPEEFPPGEEPGAQG